MNRDMADNRDAAQREIAALRQQLHGHNHRYYVLNAPEIPDEEFDRLLRRLIEWKKLFLN